MSLNAPSGITALAQNAGASLATSTLIPSFLLGLSCSPYPTWVVGAWMSRLFMRDPGICQSDGPASTTASGKCAVFSLYPYQRGERDTLAGRGWRQAYRP